MKAIFFTVSALAASVLASPAPSPANDIADILGQLESLLSEGGLDSIVETLSAQTKRDVEIQSVNDLSERLSDGLSSIQANTAAINVTLAAVESGEVSKVDASARVALELDAVQLKLSAVLHDVLGSVGVEVELCDFEELLDGTAALLCEVLSTIKGAVNLLGLSKALSTVVKAIVGILGDLVTALGKVVGKTLPDLVPNLVKTLGSLVDGFRKGVLSPLLKGLAAILNGLAE